MPDRFGFDHLPTWGVIEHRCIEEGCEHRGRFTEKERRRHAEQHERNRRRDAERRRDAALREARRRKAQLDREARLIEERFGG
jgi:hypothetical protein